MIAVNMPAFYLGVKEELEKLSRCREAYSSAFKETQDQLRQLDIKVAFDVGAMPVNENILPTITNQAKWKYVRTKDGLKLSDGNLVYGFGGFPEEYPAEDARINRLSDDNILNFENDATSKGTAQIHRSSPDSLYITLATGGHNPTFMLQHEEGKNWRYTPSKKFVEKLKLINRQTAPITESISAEREKEPDSLQDSTLIDPASLMKGAMDMLKEAYSISEGLIGGSDNATELITNAINKTKNIGNELIDQSVAHPILSMLGGYGLSKGIGKIKDIRDPRRQLLREMYPETQLPHELGHLAIGVLPTMLAGVIRA